MIDNSLMCPYCFVDESMYVNDSCPVCGLTRLDAARLNGSPHTIAVDSPPRLGPVDGAVYVGRGWWRDDVRCPVDLHIKLDPLVITARWIDATGGVKREDINCSSAARIMADWRTVRLIAPLMDGMQRHGYHARIVVNKRGGK